MRMEIREYGIQIIPESDQDRAYIRDTLGLKEKGDFIKLVQVNAIRLDCLAYLETKRKEQD